MCAHQYANIDKSGFHRGEYIGYADGTVWRIRKFDGGKRWEAIANDLPYRRIVAFTLRAISEQLSIK